jgi:hypothetical protein
MEIPDNLPTHPTTVTPATPPVKRKVVGLVRFPKGRESLSARSITRNGRVGRSSSENIPTTAQPDHKPAYKSAAERREEELAKL